MVCTLILLWLGGASSEYWKDGDDDDEEEVSVKAYQQDKE